MTIGKISFSILNVGIILYDSQTVLQLSDMNDRCKQSNEVAAVVVIPQIKHAPMSVIQYYILVFEIRFEKFQAVDINRAPSIELLTYA